MGAQAGKGVGAAAIIELDNGDRKEAAYATCTVYLPWEYLTKGANRLVNEWFALFILLLCNFFTTFECWNSPLAASFSHRIPQRPKHFDCHGQLVDLERIQDLSHL